MRVQYARSDRIRIFLLDFMFKNKNNPIVELHATEHWVRMAFEVNKQLANFTAAELA